MTQSQHRGGPGSLRMSRQACAVVLVDYQERLMPVIHESDAVAGRAAFLADVARALQVPVVGTAQNPSRLGPNVEEVHSRCDAIVEKMHFGACEDGLLDQVDALAPAATDLVVAGCEAHVCLLQTALGALEAGRRVWVVADASGSRRPGDHALAMDRLAQAGAVVVSTEMVAFEWLHTCEHERFRAVSALIKASGSPTAST